MEKHSYTPLLRIAACFALIFGLVVLVETVIIASKMKQPQAPGPFGFEADTFIVTLGGLMFFQGFFVFAVLMVFASMADSIKNIDGKIQKFTAGEK